MKATVILALVAHVKLFVDEPFGYLFHEVPSFRDYPIEDTGNPIEIHYRKEPCQSRRPGRKWLGYDILSYEEAFARKGRAREPARIEGKGGE